MLIKITTEQIIDTELDTSFLDLKVLLKLWKSDKQIVWNIV